MKSLEKIDYLIPIVDEYDSNNEDAKNAFSFRTL